MNVCDAHDCVVVPLAGLGLLHLKHQVIFHWTAVNSALAGCRRLQLWAQRPHLVQHGGEELMGILQIHTHNDAEKCTHFSQVVERQTRKADYALSGQNPGTLEPRQRLLP